VSAAITTTPGTPQTARTCDPAVRVTRSLLGYGVIAGPIYLAAGLAEALTRSGFDPTRDDLSLLSNGSLGWIHITLLVATGLMTIAAATGMRRVLAGSPGGTWGPRLVSAYGIGLAAAGTLVADPANGFPAGTPAGQPGHLSWHGMGHLISAGAGFLCLFAACFVLARWFARLGRPGWAAYSRITGAVFGAGFAAAASGSGSPATVLALWIAVVAGWAWLSAVSVLLYRSAGEQQNTKEATR
jgi:uncharacterized protein DUF998